MTYFKWLPLAFLLWGYVWLEQPPFQASTRTVQAAALTAAAKPLEPPPAPADILSEDAQAEEAEQPSAPPVFPAVRKAKTPRLSQTTNVLILGLDKKPGDLGLGRPDTLVIAVLSETSNKLGLVSVPRDLYVEIEGHGPDRLNATYSVAHRLKQSPAELTRRVLEDTLALPIHHTLSVDLGAFEALVDTLGGVSVTVPCPIYDNFLDKRTPTGRRVLDVEAGVVQMDGITAGLYARSRHGRSDFNRARRQQAILFGIKRKLTSPEGLFQLGDVVRTLENHVESDLSRAQMLSLGARLASLSEEDIHGLVLGHGHVVGTRLPDGKQVLLPDHDAIAQALGSLFAASAPGSLPEHAACFDKDAAVKGRSHN